MDRDIELEREVEIGIRRNEKGWVDEHQRPVHDTDESFDGYSENCEGGLESCEEVDRGEDVFEEGESESQPRNPETVITSTEEQRQPRSTDKYIIDWRAAQSTA